MAEFDVATGAEPRPRSARAVRREARACLREGRRLLRRHGHKVAPEARQELASALQALDAARAAGDTAEMERQAERVEAARAAHFAFAGKSALREYLESILVAVAIALFLRAFVIEAFQIPSSSMIPTLKVGDHIFVNKFLYGFRVPFTTDPPRKFWRIREPRRGEVVVFLYPSQPEKDYIKRVVAVGGDTIRFRGDRIWLKRRGEAEFVPIPRRRVGVRRYCDHDEKADAWRLETRVEWEETLGGATYRVVGSTSAPPSWSRALANTRRLSRAAVTATSDTFGPIPDGHVFVLGDNRDNSHDSRYWGTVPLDYVKGKALWTWFSRGGRVEDRCGVGVRWDRTFPRFHGVD